MFLKRLSLLAFVSVMVVFLLAAPLASSQSMGSDEPISTEHSITVRGRTMAYTARAGYLSLRDDQYQIHGRIFYTAYVLHQRESAPPRPLIFIWNGGPGSNASLLELGGLGPRRILHTGERSGNQGLVDNEDTWLQFADLVFVDPIYTGYSYAATPENQKEFLSDRGDADSIAEFIRLYRVHYQAQGSPLFLMGESYGTYRALGVADILDKHETPLRGMILLSNIYSFSEDPNLSAVFLLPNFTAAAFAHHRLSSEQQNDLAKTVAEAQHWAEQSYLSALVQGDRLAPEEKKAIADKLAHFTGIAADVWAKNDLRLSPDQFANEVLGPGKLDFIGHYDTRMVGHNSHAGAGYDVAADPSLDYGVDAAIVPYLRTELGWKSDALYAGPFGGRWPSPSSPRGDWTSVRWDWSGGSEDRSPMLAAVLKDNPGLRMLVGSGYFDLATPFAAAEYEVSQLRLAPDARARIRFVRYEGGHSVNMDTKVRAQLFQDAQALVMATGTSGASHSFPPPGNQHNPDNGVHVSSLHLTVGRSAAQEGNCRLVPAN